MAADGRLQEAIALLLSFECLLRVEEMRRVLKKHVVLSGDRRLGARHKPGLLIPLAKGGRNQWVEFLDPQMEPLMAMAIEGLGDNDAVFDFSTSSYRRLLRRCCDALGLREHFVPHSARHGGATKLHLEGWSVSDIMERGRWKQQKSCLIYLQAGRAMLLNADVPADVRDVGEACASDLVAALACAAA